MFHASDADGQKHNPSVTKRPHLLSTSALGLVPHGEMLLPTMHCRATNRGSFSKQTVGHDNSANDLWSGPRLCRLGCKPAVWNIASITLKYCLYELITSGLALFSTCLHESRLQRVSSKLRLLFVVVFPDNSVFPGVLSSKWHMVLVWHSRSLLLADRLWPGCVVYKDALSVLLEAELWDAPYHHRFSPQSWAFHRNLHESCSSCLLLHLFITLSLLIVLTCYLCSHPAHLPSRINKNNVPLSSSALASSLHLFHGWKQPLLCLLGFKHPFWFLFKAQIIPRKQWRSCYLQPDCIGREWRRCPSTGRASL